MNIIKWIFKKYEIERHIDKLKYQNEEQEKRLEQHKDWQKGYLEHISVLEEENNKLEKENKQLWKSNTDLIIKYLDLYVKRKP